MYSGQQAQAQALAGSRDMTEIQSVNNRVESIAGGLQSFVERLEAISDRLVGPQPKPITDAKPATPSPTPVAHMPRLRDGVTSLEGLCARLHTEIVRIEQL